MNLNLQKPNYLQTFAGEFSPPYWQYTVVPRVPEDEPYRVELDFAELPLADLLPYWGIADKDILEIFLLDKRVLFVGIKIEVQTPAENLVITPVTRSGVLFSSIDCSVKSNNTYLPFGGILDRNTDVLLHAFRVEEPDYLGLKIESGVATLDSLLLQVELVVSDEFSLDTLSNSSKD
jgi:hypothetical protein